MKLLVWKGNYVVDGTNSRMRRVIETDFEDERRRRKIAQMQRIDAAVGLVWITACFFCVSVLVAGAHWLGKLYYYVQGLLR